MDLKYDQMETWGKKDDQVRCRHDQDGKRHHMDSDSGVPACCPRYSL